jgi:pimeloyl-ACP methyl ester carboxylesterase
VALAGALGPLARATRDLASGRRTAFPDEILPGPAQLGRGSTPTLTYFNAVDNGGHFAAWEEPQLFSAELRAAFISVR